MTITQAWAGEITKFEKVPEGLMVYGKATGPDLDLDGQIADPKWLRKAMPDWMAWGNVREMHRPSAAGVGKELSAAGDDWNLKALVVDDQAARKVEAGVYKGFSIGIASPQVVNDRDAPGGRIVGGTVVEVSLVDRPCNPTATMGIAKAYGGVLSAVEMAGEVAGKAADDAPVSAPPDDSDDAEMVTPDEDDLLLANAAAKAARTAEVREMIDGLEADDDAPIFAEVVKGARVENALDTARTYLAERGILTPTAYRKTQATVAAVLAGTLVKRKVDETADIAGAKAILSQLADLIISEATELKAGRMEELGDIRQLMEACQAVRYFISCEMRQDGTEVDDGSTAPADVAWVGMAAKPDAGATLGDVQAAKAAAPDGVPAPEAPDITEMIDEAVAKAGRASEGRIKALEAELAKVAATPVPGGPYILPAAAAQSAPPDDRASRAAHFAAQAKAASDPGVRFAYESAARDLATQ